MKLFKVAIIGAGPAGISCAIQLKRYNVDFVIFERDKPGGLLINANMVENYPGFPKGISGEKLASLFCKQLKLNKIKLIKENVEYVDYKKNYLIRTNCGLYESEILVIASGTKPKTLDIQINEDIESKIFYEIVKLKNKMNKEIGIIGAGDAAFDYALNLSVKNRVFLINRKEEHKCLPLLFSNAMKNKNIKYVKGFELTKIAIKNNKLLLHSSSKKSIVVDFLLIAIGRKPNLDFLNRNIIINTLMNREIFFIGDVKNGLFRQTGIAVGDGIRAGMEIVKKV